ncbi:MAG: hypothetical protein J6S40_01320 [Thermoguttaceae bacterium]|nr:hypothetical protein [Thermoguttaceae bacterium]
MKTPVQEANSLEKLLISTGNYLKENREKCMQTLLLILVAIAAVIFLRTYFYGKPKKFQQDFDQAYAISSQQAMLTGLPSVEPYDTLAAHYNRGDAGAEVRVNAAETTLKIGRNQVERKKAASRAGKAAADVIAMDPEATFNDAIKRFETVTSPQMAADPNLAARALYGLASAWENLASVTAGDDEVNVKLDTAKGVYQQVVDGFAETPFAHQARMRIDILDEPLTREFYKKTAADYVAMPVPEELKPEESILPDNSGELDPNAEVGSEDFSLEGDQVEAPAETAPEAEPAAPVEETAPAEEAAPAEPAAEPEAAPAEGNG